MNNDFDILDPFEDALFLNALNSLSHGEFIKAVQYADEHIEKYGQTARCAAIKLFAKLNNPKLYAEISDSMHRELFSEQSIHDVLSNLYEIDKMLRTADRDFGESLITSLARIFELAVSTDAGCDTALQVVQLYELIQAYGVTASSDSDFMEKGGSDLYVNFDGSRAAQIADKAVLVHLEYFLANAVVCYDMVQRFAEKQKDETLARNIMTRLNNAPKTMPRQKPMVKKSSSNHVPTMVILSWILGFFGLVLFSLRLFGDTDRWQSITLMTAALVVAVIGRRMAKKDADRRHLIGRILLGVNVVACIFMLVINVLFSTIGWFISSMPPADDNSDYPDGEIFNVDGLTYQVISATADSVKVIGAYSDIDDVIVPDTVNGHYVFEIAEGAFRDRTLRSVEISDNVITIGSYAFSHCETLERIRMGKNVSYIGGFAFEYCTSLADVNIPEGVLSIEDGTFSECHNLRSVYLPEGILSIGERAFNNCSSLDKVNVPNSVINLHEYAFFGCASLNGISIPPSISNIMPYTFAECSSLLSIDLPHGLSTIADGAFENCTALQSITLPSTVISLGDYAFAGCRSLQYAELKCDATSIADHCFFGCESLTYIGLPENLNYIHPAAFGECISLSSVTIPKYVYDIGEEAFLGCHNLLSVTNLSDLPLKKGDSSYGFVAFYANELIGGEESVGGEFVFEIVDEVATLVRYNGSRNETYLYLPESYNGSPYGIGDFAFEQFELLQEVVFPPELLFIGDYAFYNCKSLVSAHIPYNTRTVGKYAFGNCTALTTVSLPEFLEVIEDGVLSGCEALEHIQIPDSVTEIGDSAFLGCAISAVHLPRGLEVIKDRAFKDCASLNIVYLYSEKLTFEGGFEGADGIFCDAADNGFTLVIGADVIEIPDFFTFVNTARTTSRLTSIDFGDAGSCLTIGNYAFTNNTALKKVTLPANLTRIGDCAFSGCNMLFEVNTNDRLETIGSGAFYGCTSLCSITLPPLLTQIGTSAFGCCHKLIEVIDHSYLFDVVPGAQDAGEVAYAALTVHKEESRIYDSEGFRFLRIDDKTYLLGLSEDGFEGRMLPDEHFGEYEIYKYAFYGSEIFTKLTIPSSVTKIHENAFAGCKSLLSVSIDRIGISLGSSAFADCSSLERVTLPAGVTAIPDSFLANASSLEQIYLPSSVSVIGIFAFNGCDNIKNVYFAGAAQDFERIETYSNTALLESATITYDYGVSLGLKFTESAGYCTLTGIGSCADEVIVIPSYHNGKKVTAIGADAFRSNITVTGVIIPPNVTVIESSAFMGCSALVDIYIPDSVTEIASYAFSECVSLGEIVIPERVRILDFSCLRGCTALRRVTLPEELTEIKGHAFEGCVVLKEINIPSTVSLIGTYAFAECYSLEKVELLGIEVISAYTFFDCTSLREITLTSQLITIEGSAFEGCYAIEHIFYLGDFYDWSRVTVYGEQGSLPDATITYSEDTGDIPTIIA